MTEASAATVIARKRSAGYSGSSGTYPAPVFATASSGDDGFADRSKQTATRDPRPDAARACRSRASRFATRVQFGESVSERGRRQSRSRPGVAAACASNARAPACDHTGAAYRSRRRVCSARRSRQRARGDDDAISGIGADRARAASRTREAARCDVAVRRKTFARYSAEHVKCRRRRFDLGAKIERRRRFVRRGDG